MDFFKSKSLKPSKVGFWVTRSKLKEVVELYYDALSSSDPVKVREIFHENA
ncbi:MAG: hypothetical protein GWP41_07420 [Planctomycetia bacterium]|nr:hypothetical protein [Planctomycetia bacterium]NCF98360.1 hypothetical protein [Planctomycetia bacterium]NCG11789.1 hypothetical protein [Planctomycetia bacterium]